MALEAKLDEVEPRTAGLRSELDRRRDAFNRCRSRLLCELDPTSASRMAAARMGTAIVALAGADGSQVRGRRGRRRHEQVRSDGLPKAEPDLHVHPSAGPRRA